MQLRELRLNVKPGKDRPARVPLGKITVVKGDHGVGKTRLEQGLSFALRGGLHDVALRHATFVKDSGLLLRATLPTEPALFGEVVISDGTKTTTYRREMKISRDEESGATSGGRPSQKVLPWGIDPDRVLPIADIEASLTKRPDEVRSVYLSRIASPGTAEEVAALLGQKLTPIAEALLGEALPCPTTLEELRGLRTTCRGRLAMTGDSLLGAEQTVAAIEATLPAMPDEERLTYLKAMAAFLRIRGDVEAGVKDLRTATEGLNNAQANLDVLAPPPGARPTAPEHTAAPVQQAPVFMAAPPPANALENPFLAHQKVQLWILTHMIQTCPICAGTIDFAAFGAQMGRTKSAADALATLTTLPQAPVPAPVVAGPSPERLAYEAAVREFQTQAQAWEDKNRRRLVAEAEIQRLQGVQQGAQARVQAAMPKVQELGTALVEAQKSAGDDSPQEVIAGLDAAASAPRWYTVAGEYDQRTMKLAEDRGAWETYRNAKKHRDDLRDRKPRLVKITDTCDTVIKTMMQEGIDTFLARMTAYMVPGWEPLILLQDERGSDSFTLAVRVDGVVNYDPSGMQSLNLLYAFAIALFERDPTPLMVLISPVERPVSAKYLPKLAKALSTAPEGVQVILTTTADVPKRGMPKGVVVLDLDEPASIEKALSDPAGQEALFTAPDTE